MPRDRASPACATNSSSREPNPSMISSSLGPTSAATRSIATGPWAFASVLTSAVVGTFYLQRFLPSVPLWQAAALSVAANIAGQLGDLAESAMKRGAHVKDSGVILPGHGGLLDRVDSTLFALPVIYAYLRLV